MVHRSSVSRASSCSADSSIPSRPSTIPVRWEDRSRIPCGPFSGVTAAVTLNIAASLGWLWMVEGQRPVAPDLLGALLAICRRRRDRRRCCETASLNRSWRSRSPYEVDRRHHRCATPIGSRRTCTPSGGAARRTRWILGDPIPPGSTRQRSRGAVGARAEHGSSSLTPRCLRAWLRPPASGPSRSVMLIAS